MNNKLKKKDYIIYIFIILFILFSYNVLGSDYNVSNSHGFSQSAAGDGTYRIGVYFSINTTNVTKIFVIQNPSATSNNVCLLDNSKAKIMCAVYTSHVANFSYNFVNATRYGLADNFDLNQSIHQVESAYIASSLPVKNQTINWLGEYDNTGNYNLLYLSDIIDIITEISNTTTSPPATINYTIINYQNPNDINTSTTGKLNITTNITIQGTTLNNSNNVSIYYTSHTALGNGCSIYYQTQCIDNGNFKEKNMIKINNSLFEISFDDDEYFPGYYPFNQTIISKSEHGNITIYNNNNLKFNIYNFSTNATDYFITIDFYAINKTSSSGSLIIMYCNSSYTTGNPLTNINCVVVDAFLPTQLFSHFENKSYYLSAPISIRNVTKTNTSYFVFISGSNIANGWNFAYVNNTNYNNASFNYGSFTTWGNTSAIFDMHIHPLLASDYFKYYTTLTDNGTTTTSNTTYDFYNITNFAPSAPLLLQPCGENFTISNTINASVFYNWTPSIDINGDSFNYTLYYENTNHMNIPSTNTSTTLIFSNAGVFSTYVKACDIFGNCDTGNTCEFTICKSNYVKNIQPCINDARLINYSDSNLCSVFGYDIPSDNGMFENCKSSNTQALNNIALKLEYLSGIILIFIAIYFIFKKRN